MATASSVSKILLPEAFSGSNTFESYSTHFEQLTELQNLKSTVTRTEVDERRFYFAYISKKYAIQFYPNLPETTTNSIDETIEAFRRHYSEKSVIFCGRLARRVQQADKKLTIFLGICSHWR